MQQKYTDIENYFECLSREHLEIKTFCRYELEELLDKTCSIQGFPALILEGFDFDYSGSTPDNILKNRTGAFCIVNNCDVFNSKERTETCENNEIIAEQILMRMVSDKKKRLPLLTGFDITSAEGFHFVNPVLGYVFCRINFSFKTKITENTKIWELS